MSDIDQAIMVVSETCKPSPASFISIQLAKCDAACKTRKEDAQDLKARSAVFADGLREFPVDCVADAFQTWMRCEKFTPSLADIRDNCWKEYRARFGLLNMLKKMRKDTSKTQEAEKPKAEKNLKRIDEIMKQYHKKVSEAGDV